VIRTSREGTPNAAKPSVHQDISKTTFDVCSGRSLPVSVCGINVILGEEKSSMDNRRQDVKTQSFIDDARKIARAFGQDAGKRFLELRGVNGELATRVILHPNLCRQR
jgi:hypothetical protein